MEKPIVYFTKEISAESILKIYEKIGVTLTDPVAVKVHSGERGNTNFLGPQLFKSVVEKVNGTICECNTAYNGARNHTQIHLELMKEHEWSTVFGDERVDILDYDEDINKDLVLDIDGGYAIDKNYVGGHLKEYNSMLVLSHFKGHPMGGFGAALKQLSIGCGSSFGKTNIHTAGKTTDPELIWQNIAPQDKFVDAMADAAYSVTQYFKNKGGVVYINVIKNVSVDCDCVATPKPPCMGDIVRTIYYLYFRVFVGQLIQWLLTRHALI